MRVSVYIRHYVSPDCRDIHQICHGSDSPVGVINSCIRRVEEGVLYGRLFFEAIHVARKSQEDVFGIENAGTAGREVVEAIHQETGPEGPPPAFCVTGAVQAVRECRQIRVLGLLDLQVQLQPAGRSERSPAKVPSIVEVVGCKIVQGKEESRLDQLQAERATAASIPGNCCKLRPERPVLNLK